MIITCKCGKYEFEVNKNETNKHGIRKILYFYDRLVMKFTSYPSYCIELYFKKNLKIISSLLTSINLYNIMVLLNLTTSLDVKCLVF